MVRLGGKHFLFFYSTRTIVFAYEKDIIEKKKTKKQKKQNKKKTPDKTFFPINALLFVNEFWWY